MVKNIVEVKMSVIYENKNGERFINQSVLIPEGWRARARAVGIKNLSEFTRNALEKEIINREGKPSTAKPRPDQPKRIDNEH